MARLRGSEEALGERLNINIREPADLAYREDVISAIRERLDARTCAAAVAAGRALMLDQAVAAVLEDDEWTK